jgi:metal transporter CNNM
MAIAVRGTVDDMREHLKHLGPSNLASRPKTTRYSTVKIKSGHPVRSDSRTESTVLPDPIIEEPYHDDPAPQGGEGEGLLKSAGKDASDGVQALQQGYGSFSQKSQDSRSRLSKNEIYVDGEARKSTLSVNKTRQSQSPEKRPLSRHDSNDSGRSSDTLGSLNGSSSRKKRGNARSGSITENIVEAGGIRKVVLETNSSSDDRDENGNEHYSIKATSATSKGLDGQADSPDDHSEQLALSKGEEVKKKRRRNRKKKSAKAGGEEGSGAAAQ